MLPVIDTTMQPWILRLRSVLKLVPKKTSKAIALEVGNELLIYILSFLGFCHFRLWQIFIFVFSC